MKKIIYTLTFIFTLLMFFGCSTKLEIVNDTSFALDLISWFDQDGKRYWFGDDLVWDYVLHEYIYGLNPGSSDEQSVEPGDSPVYFWFPAGGPEFKTVDIISVDKREKESYVLTNNTLIIEASGKSATIEEKATLISTTETSTPDKNKRLQEYNKMKTER